MPYMETRWLCLSVSYKPISPSKVLVTFSVNGGRSEEGTVVSEVPKGKG